MTTDPTPPAGPCPGCGGGDWHPVGTQAVCYAGLPARVAFRRRWWACGGCGRPEPTPDYRPRGARP